MGRFKLAASDLGGAKIITSGAIIMVLKGDNLDRPSLTSMLSKAK
jgi:hypothetical protein